MNNFTRLLETLDRPAPFKWKSYGDWWQAVFFVEDMEYVVGIVYHDGVDWELIFSNESIRSEEITGTGNEFKVFATVAAIFDDWYKTHKDASIFFSAKEPSRVKLYKKFAKRLIKKYKYKLHKMPTKDSNVSFYFKKY